MLGREAVSCAVYEGNADAEAARDFISSCSSTLVLPEACVLDVALMPDRGRCLLEANAAWGAGLNGCDPAAAIRCIDRATSYAG
jgi:hypothetical protein